MLQWPRSPRGREKAALQQRGVQAIGLRPPMLAHRDAGGMDHMRLDATGF
jgi:hypothetical protein